MCEGDIMSATFYGMKADGKPIMLDLEHPSRLNVHFGGGYALLGLLGINPGEDCLQGDCSVPEARRGIMLARATFERRAPGQTEEPSDTKRPGHCRVISGGISEEYLRRNLDSFERFLNTVVEMGATSIYWA
jgi:hypothetical protein